MQYELSTEIIKILDDLAERFGVVIDWADKNVMPYLMELYDRFITYKIVENSLTLVLFIIVFAVCILFFSKFIKYYRLGKKSGESNLFIDVTKYITIPNSYLPTGFSIFVSVFLVIALIATTITAFYAANNIIELIFIPELYIIDYLSTYM